MMDIFLTLKKYRPELFMETNICYSRNVWSDRQRLQSKDQQTCRIVADGERFFININLQKLSSSS